MFVGSSVNAVRTERGRKVSDVVDILLFLAGFVREKARFVLRLIGCSGSGGLMDSKGHEVFANAFAYLVSKGDNAESIFNDVLAALFNAPAQAALHVENLKGSEGEIALKLGDNEPFGVINVGDTSTLCKLCEEHPEFVVSERVLRLAFSGLQDQHDDQSADWLQEIHGRLEQLARQHDGPDECRPDRRLADHPVVRARRPAEGLQFWVETQQGLDRNKGSGAEAIHLLETLNVFGVRAQFMQQFKEYLEEEGLPPNDDRIEFVLPTFKNLGTQKLKILRLPPEMDFKTDGPKPVLAPPDADMQGRRIALDWYPKIQSRIAPDLAATADVAPRYEGKLHQRPSGLFRLARDVDRQLQEFKNERAWFNLNLTPDACRALLEDPSWYVLYIPPQELEIGRFRPRVPLAGNRRVAAEKILRRVFQNQKSRMGSAATSL